MYASERSVRRPYIKQTHRYYNKLPSSTWSRKRRTVGKSVTPQYVVHHKWPKLRKILWVAITLATTAVCAYVCHERIEHYIEDHSEINIYYVDNKTINFPSTTVCPLDVKETPSVNPTLYERRFGNYTTTYLDDLFKTSNYPFRDLWDVSKIDRNWTIFKSNVGPKNASNQKENAVLDTDTILGKCTTFTGKRNVPHYGTQSYQVIRWQGENTKLRYLMVQHHLDEDTALVRHLIRYTGIIYSYESWDFYLHATEVIHRNTRRKPCSEDEDAVSKCIVGCLEKAIYSRVKKKCRLPYMQEISHIAPCTTTEEFTDVVSVSQKIGQRFQKEDCNCSRKCRETLYSTEFVTNAFHPDNKNIIRFVMIFADRTITVTEEEAVYSGFALFSDLGGSVGLFLGISALEAFKTLASFMSKMGNQLNKMVKIM